MLNVIEEYLRGPKNRNARLFRDMLEEISELVVKDVKQQIISQLEKDHNYSAIDDVNEIQIK